MDKVISVCTSIRASLFLGILAITSILLSSGLLSVIPNVHAIGTFSKDDRPFNMTNDEWAAEYWNKWIGKNADEATPQAGGCLLVNDDNKTEPMIM